MSKSMIQISGMKKALAMVDKAGPKGQAALAGAMYSAALEVMRESVKNTPVVTGRLRNSHFVTVPRPGKGSSKLQVRFGYGVKYAFRVHEGITVKVRDMPKSQQAAFWARMKDKGWATADGVSWRKSDQGGAKFLERAIDKYRRKVGRIIARLTFRNFERGYGVRVDSGMPRNEEAGRRKAETL